MAINDYGDLFFVLAVILVLFILAVAFVTR